MPLRQQHHLLTTHDPGHVSTGGDLMGMSLIGMGEYLNTRSPVGGSVGRFRRYSRVEGNAAQEVGLESAKPFLVCALCFLSVIRDGSCQLALQPPWDHEPKETLVHKSPWSWCFSTATWC